MDVLRTMASNGNGIGSSRDLEWRASIIRYKQEGKPNDLIAVRHPDFASKVVLCLRMDRQLLFADFDLVDIFAKSQIYTKELTLSCEGVIINAGDFLIKARDAI